MDDAVRPLAGLGYVGIDAPDPIAWREFAVGICGLAPAWMPPGPPWLPWARSSPIGQSCAP